MRCWLALAYIALGVLPTNARLPSAQVRVTLARKAAPIYPAIAYEASVAILDRKRFKVGDHVGWNSEAGPVGGWIVRVVTSKIQFKGYTVHASEDEPQYEIKSDKTDHIAMHKGTALHKLGD